MDQSERSAGRWRYVRKALEAAKDLEQAARKGKVMDRQRIEAAYDDAWKVFEAEWEQAQETLRRRWRDQVAPGDWGYLSADNDDY